ncbi:MAG TPA: hypothetical protein PLM53_17940 [Spirochaetota bacterium]|nr:hypothetical protein [Spirochaetota bacterium]HPL16385.1 hypothetical protein [Spirochaetota bacterium]HQF08344.1 hypothetical protein [Spirochaetota bacterium]HQH98981.1 hypothetical protein [Spirochaetota bacterium]HQJ72676.1 hypothetical protein [Spirochaetota bacterium]
MMETINHEKLFNDRINARLRSEEWDLGVARDVFRRRRNRHYLIGASGSLGSMAAAVLVALFLTAAPDATRYGEGVNALVNAQIQGTYNQVFAGRTAADNSTAVFAEAQFDDSTDAMIDETLEQRL